MYSPKLYYANTLDNILLLCEVNNYNTLTTSVYKSDWVTTAARRKNNVAKMILSMNLKNSTALPYLKAKTRVPICLQALRQEQDPVAGRYKTKIWSKALVSNFWTNRRRQFFAVHESLTISDYSRDRISGETCSLRTEPIYCVAVVCAK